MSLDDQVRWDRQHAETLGAEAPSSLLQQIFETGAWQLPAGHALDIAAGKGRNALYLAGRGFKVVAVDISGVALDAARRHAEQKRLHVDFQHLDLEQGGFPEREYDLILNINYLQRSLIPKIRAALRVGGHVIFETYSIDQQVIGHPKNPNYLLAHNELLDHFRDFRVLYYREGKFSDGGEPSFRAGIFAQRM
ncbi:MAG TPA: class I SAM-dependent methyltransferase [Candidatus Binatia bacterium]|jgi:2-polyprenyl-3-methyl-5-hydroxy-6-metoxy-1,4-benzoquinol methylase|nr:class I SAM-dependent methyltransferase [Candidatus Binatia bacterium]